MGATAFVSLSGSPMLWASTKLSRFKSLTIFDGLAAGPISDAFDSYCHKFSLQTGINIERIQSLQYNLSSSPLASDTADIIFQSEFVSATLASALDQNKKIPYVPVSHLYPSSKQIKWLAGLDIHYGSADGHTLYALPFNPSMGVVFTNDRLLNQHQIKPNGALTRWSHIYDLGQKLASRGLTGFTFSWCVAYTLEYFGSLHNLPIASHENGFLGKPSFNLHEQSLFVQFFQKLFEGTRTKVYKHVSNRTELAEAFFGEFTCGMLMQGSGRLPYIQKWFNTKNRPFEYTVHPLPYDDTLIAEPMAPKIGGTGMWVTEKGSENQAVVDFIRFAVQPENQAFWSRYTGYMPASVGADEALSDTGFYDVNPHVKVAAMQGRRPASFRTHVRIPGYNEIRTRIFLKHYEYAIHQVLADTSPPYEVAYAFLKAFSEDANAHIEQSLSYF